MHRIITIEEKKKTVPDKVSVMAGWVCKTPPPEVTFPTCITQLLHFIWLFGDFTTKISILHRYYTNFHFKLELTSW